MSPADLIREQYRHHCMDFDAYVRIHFDSGFVFATPTYFIMGRAVVRDADETQIRNPMHFFAYPDAWWIHAMAGDLTGVWKIMPYPLESVGFERFDEEPRFYPIDTLRRLTIGNTQPTHDHVMVPQ